MAIRHRIRNILRERRPRGQSLVEFAIILPVFAMLFAATLDLGRLFYAQITLTNAAREGAFEAARDPGQFKAGQPCDTDANRVVCRVILESNQSFVQISPSDIDMWCSPDCGESLGNTVTVSVDGKFRFVTPLLAPFFGGGQLIDLNARAVAAREFVPTPPPNPAYPTIAPTDSPTPSPSPTGSPTGTPTPATECTVQFDPYIGTEGVYPPDVIGDTPSEASGKIEAKGLVPVPEGDLTTGQRNRVREQNPDSTVCVPLGWEVHFKYRP